ncbi:MAG TPA: hypothetical protein VHC43_05935 [Mycobacteriales bacterium]|nr:hypothetical protein [Mycobacteriales bacterium]
MPIFRRRERLGQQELNDQAINEANWTRLMQSVAAAHAGDPMGHTQPLRERSADRPFDWRFGAWVYYLLRWRVRELIGTSSPDVPAVKLLAANHYPAYAELIKGDVSSFENVLLTVLDLVEPEHRVKGAMLNVTGTAALGVLLDDPVRDLTELRPGAEAFWQNNEAAARAAQALHEA